MVRDSLHFACSLTDHRVYTSAYSFQLLPIPWISPPFSFSLSHPLPLSISSMLRSKENSTHLEAISRKGESERRGEGSGGGRGGEERGNWPEEIDPYNGMERERSFFLLEHPCTSSLHFRHVSHVDWWPASFLTSFTYSIRIHALRPQETVLTGRSIHIRRSFVASSQ